MSLSIPKLYRTTNNAIPDIGTLWINKNTNEIIEIIYNKEKKFTFKIKSTGAIQEVHKIQKFYLTFDEINR